jgi:hypothetical protein
MMARKKVLIFQAVRSRSCSCAWGSAETAPGNLQALRGGFELSDDFLHVRRSISVGHRYFYRLPKPAHTRRFDTIRLIIYDRIRAIVRLLCDWFA